MNLDPDPMPPLARNAQVSDASSSGAPKRTGRSGADDSGAPESAGVPSPAPADPRDGYLACMHGDDWKWHGMPASPELTAERDQLANVFSDAHLLFWTARVHKIGDDYRWELNIAPESFRSPLLDYTGYRRHGFFWHPAYAPDYERTEKTYREALERGADRYRQEFRVDYRGRTVWLDEVVRMVATGPNEWRFSGLLREITEQKFAEAAERRATEELRRLLDHAQCMLWHATVTDSGGGSDPRWVLKFLPSGLQRRIFGDADLAETSKLYDAFDVPDRIEMHARATQALRRGAQGYQQEFSITSKLDGQRYWIREYVAIEPEGAGRWRLSGVMIDVTAQKLAEFAQQSSELQLRRLLEHVDCIFWSARLIPVPPDDHHWEINAPPSRLFRRLFGTDPANPVHLWTREGTPEYDQMAGRWRQAIAQGATAYEQEFRHFSGGNLYWLHESVSVLERTNGILHLAGVVVDITQRKLAELQLTAEKERLAVTLGAMDEGVVTIGTRGEVHFLNRAAEELLQVGALDALGRPLDGLATLQSGHPARPVPWLSVEDPSDFTPETQLLRKSGQTVRIEGCTAPLHDPAGQRTGAVIVLRDVTERHMLQSQLQRASTLESVGLLAGGIAHDFNNILTALLANLSLAQMDVPPGTKLADYLRESRTATDRASALARQLLTFARGGDPLVAAVDLGDVIQEVTRFTLRGTQVDHTLDLAQDLWPARADRGQLAQIIQNLVLNAAQSMPHGGTIRIAATNEEIEAGTPGRLGPGRYVRLRISDTGSGIAPEMLEKIFTPYFTTKQSGHGLGLAVVYSIVKKHHGAVDVHSASGGGTTFDILLPAATRSERMTAGPAVRTAGTLIGRVLLMDDELPILRVVRTYLERLGLEVETAEDGQQAVERFRDAFARRRAHDIVIMDLTVPGRMGGREAIAALKAIDPGVCAIVASGYSNDPVLANYREFGFCAVAAKPYDIEQLGLQVAGLLRQRR